MKNKQLPLFKALTIGLVVFWVDLFCGAGGTSTGIHQSNANAVVVACVNHDAVAIASHKENHPDCAHFTEDIRDFNVVLKIKTITDKLRKDFPGCKINVWASAECTHLSGAAGGISRSADSRTLSDHLYMYVEALNPDYFYLENVREFLTWGPLRLKEGKNSTADYSELAEDKKRNKFYVNVPNKEQKGIFYTKWRDNLKSYGFNYDYKLLNVADFEAYTSRLRYFGVFAKNGLPINFPKPTANKDGSNGLKKHKAVKEVLDFEDKGNSLFSKKRAKKSLMRFLDGLKENASEHFLMGFYGNGQCHSVEEPCNTLTTKDRYQLNYIQYDYSNVGFSSVERPAGTLTTNPKHNLVSIDWMMDFQYDRVSLSVEKPCVTIIARQDKSPLYLCQAEIGFPENEIKDDDCEVTREIKLFMIKHHIKNIYVRMLKVKELLKIQGFPEDYILKGNQADQKKFIGNSVAPLMAQKLIEANYEGLKEYLMAA
jgi:DNA (cytosine-5)-methyltransferase 1